MSVLVAAGALGAADGVLLLGVDGAAESDPLAGADALGFAELSPPLLLAAAGFGDEYRSLYHPLPLNCTAGAVSVRSSSPPQCGQTVNSGSENFWIFSVWRPHWRHWYS